MWNNMHQSKDSEDMSPPASPSSPTTRDFHAVIRRKRTVSESEKILAGPTFYGRVSEFCREKGHGYILPGDGGDKLFLHISDIESDFVPKEGDQVCYKLMPIPPKNQRYAAVHVQIVHLKDEVPHETWDKSGRKVDTSITQS